MLVTMRLIVEQLLIINIVIIITIIIIPKLTEFQIIIYKLQRFTIFKHVYKELMNFNLLK